MKNAFVLIDHHGDSGTAREGQILTNVTDHRFETLERQGLVREATDAEVKKLKQAEQPENKQAPEASNKDAPKAANKSAK